MFGLGIIGFLIYAYTIYDVVISNFHNSSDRVVWLLIVILLPLLGTVLWFLVGRSKRI